MDNLLQRIEVLETNCENCLESITILKRRVLGLVNLSKIKEGEDKGSTANDTTVYNTVTDTWTPVDATITNTCRGVSGISVKNTTTSIGSCSQNIPTIEGNTYEFSLKCILDTATKAGYTIKDSTGATLYTSSDIFVHTLTKYVIAIIAKKSPTKIILENRDDVVDSIVCFSDVSLIDITNIDTSILEEEYKGNTGDGDLACKATLNNPSDVLVDSAGNIYIADTGNHVIRKIAFDTKVITTIAGKGIAGFYGDKGLATLANLNSPREITFDNDGSILIADTGNHAIRKIDAVTGIITTIAGSCDRDIECSPIYGTPALKDYTLRPITWLSIDDCCTIYFGMYDGVNHGVYAITHNNTIVHVCNSQYVGHAGQYGYISQNTVIPPIILRGVMYYVSFTWDARQPFYVIRKLDFETEEDIIIFGDGSNAGDTGNGQAFFEYNSIIDGETDASEVCFGTTWNWTYVFFMTSIDINKQFLYAYIDRGGQFPGHHSYMMKINLQTNKIYKVFANGSYSNTFMAKIAPDNNFYVLRAYIGTQKITSLDPLTMDFILAYGNEVEEAHIGWTLDFYITSTGDIIFYGEHPTSGETNKLYEHTSEQAVGVYQVTTGEHSTIIGTSPVDCSHTPSGYFCSFVGDNTDAHMSSFSGHHVALDVHNNIYFSDFTSLEGQYKGAIRRIDAETRIVTTVAGSIDTDFVYDTLATDKTSLCTPSVVSSISDYIEVIPQQTITPPTPIENTITLVVLESNVPVETTDTVELLHGISLGIDKSIYNKSAVWTFATIPSNYAIHGFKYKRYELMTQQYQTYKCKVTVNFTNFQAEHIFSFMLIRPPTVYGTAGLGSSLVQGYSGYSDYKSWKDITGSDFSLL